MMFARQGCVAPDPGLGGIRFILNMISPNRIWDAYKGSLSLLEFRRDQQTPNRQENQAAMGSGCCGTKGLPTTVPAKPAGTDAGKDDGLLQRIVPASVMCYNRLVTGGICQ